MAGVLGIPPKYCYDFISSALPKKPHVTSPKDVLERKGAKRSGLTSTPLLLNRVQQRKTLPQKNFLGYLAVDGKYYPTKEKAIRVTRAVEERERFLQWLECRENNRLERLKAAAKSGDIVFTKDGVFESKPCPSCGAYHKLPSLCNVNEPCPCSKIANSQLKKYSAKTSEKKSKVSRHFFSLDA